MASIYIDRDRAKMKLPQALLLQLEFAETRPRSGGPVQLCAG